MATVEVSPPPVDCPQASKEALVPRLDHKIDANKPRVLLQQGIPESADQGPAHAAFLGVACRAQVRDLGHALRNVHTQALHVGHRVPCHFDGDVLMRMPLPGRQDVRSARRQAEEARRVGCKECRGLRGSEPEATLAELVPQPEFCLQELEIKEGRLD